MPIYEYKCDKCKEIKEVIHGISEELEVVCGNCNNNMHKIISQSSFILKGDGWYATERRKEQNNKVVETAV